MLFLWLKFIIAAAIVVFSGYRICIYADRIARILNVGHSFVGLMLLAVVTSLPELAVTISATRIGAFDLALGDLVGSNLFNLTIIGIIFLKFTKQDKLLSFDSIHVISSAFSVLLISLAAIGIVYYNVLVFAQGSTKMFLDVEPAFILVTYFFGAYLIFKSEKGKMDNAAASQPEAGNKNIAASLLKFLLYSGILVASAVYLCRLGDNIAQIPVAGVALGGTFVGGLFIAGTTSLPEMAVSIAAVKLGFLDMALGNIFGSNMFNMALIPVMDLCVGRKAILSMVAPLHLLTVFFVLVSTALVNTGLIVRSQKRMPALAWDSASIIFVYCAANLVNFYLR